jgi:hypothetical protein
MTNQLVHSINQFSLLNILLENTLCSTNQFTFFCCFPQQNSVFMGPVLSVPLMLFAVYGMGAGTSSIPVYMRVIMCLSYLRFGFEGLMYAVYGNGRPMVPCPPEETYCHFRSPKTLLLETGMENSNIWVAVLALTAYMILFKAMCYFLLRWRLSRHRDFAALNYVGRIIKTHFNFTQ